MGRALCILGCHRWERERLRLLCGVETEYRRCVRCSTEPASV